MYTRLYNLWFIDHRARARLYIVSLAVGVSYALGNIFLLGRPEGKVTWETIAVLCVAMSGFTLSYCTTEEKKAPRRQRRVRPVFTRGTLLATIAVTTMVILSVFLPRGAFVETTTLLDIRTKVQTAEAERIVLPPSQIANYKTTLRVLPPSTREYWITVAAVINYQSLLNQIGGGAPDPTQVSRPCVTGSIPIIYHGLTFSECVVDLDGAGFESVIFRDSVVVYQGGRVLALKKVTFINCRFVLAFPPAAMPAQPDLLRTLLNSVDQKNVQIPG